jgi:signal transduction histidine kinase/CheY-like chemotaxis protein
VSGQPPSGERFLVLAPGGEDGPLTRALLADAELNANECADVAELCREIERGAAAVLVSEEMLLSQEAEPLRALLAEQEPWSDLPLLLLTGDGALVQDDPPPSLEPLASWGNVLLLERPMRPLTLLSAARAALRARRRQYQVREAMLGREQALQQRDQFLAVLGHELRNPLAAITLATGAIERAGAPSNAVAVLRRQSALLKRLVDDLLDVARVTSGRITLRTERVDLGRLLERVVQAAVSLPGADRARVELDPPGEALIVVGDPVRLEQVFANLLTNAFKYSPTGGRVLVSLRAEGAAARVRVRDEGVGLAPEVLPHVFDLFAQADGSLDRSQGGLGVGLTLVQNLVRLHRGEVTAASDGLGKGSTFTVRLPLAEAPVAAALSSPAHPATRGEMTGRRVLVLEDNDDTRMLLQAELETLGHVVSVARDGQEGVALALALRPEVLIIDIGLPRLDGYEVARRLRPALGQDVLLIALTGYGQPEDKRRAFEAGFDLHFTKPIDLDQLHELVANPRSPG